jgi:hypothetical protein
MGLTICDNHTRQARLVDILNGVTAEDAVRDNGKHFGSAMLIKRSSCFGKLHCNSSQQLRITSDSAEAYRSASICHIIDDDGNLVLDITNEDHAADNIGSRALLVNEGKSRVETVSNRRRALGTACVGRDNDAVLDIQVVFDPAKHGRLRVQVVDRDIEEALDLGCVQIHCDDMVLTHV